MEAPRKILLPLVEMSNGAATTPTKGGIVGGVEGAMQAMCRQRHFWTGLPFPGAATTPTKGGIVGGVEGAMQAMCRQRHFWTGLPFPGAATTPTKGGIVGGADGALAVWTERGRCGQGDGGVDGQMPASTARCTLMDGQPGKHSRRCPQKPVLGSPAEITCRNTGRVMEHIDIPSRFGIH